MSLPGLKKAGDCVRILSSLFIRTKISEPVQSANYIVAHALNKKSISQCNPSQTLSKAQEEAVFAMSRQRLQHKPIQYILGEWDFSGLELLMKSPVFIPRPETEELVENIIKMQPATEQVYFLEVGCGSGAISLALLSKLPKARCVAVELNPHAAELTKQNAIKNNLHQRIEVVNISFDDFVKRREFLEFDFLVSNPPYIPTPDMSNLQIEVSMYEDVLALDGGVDGLDMIRKIIKASSHLVKNHGSVWLETDTSHGELLKEFPFWESKLELVDIHNDFTGRPRFCHIKVGRKS